MSANLTHHSCQKHTRNYQNIWKLLLKYERFFWKEALKYTQNQDELEDIVQEAFLLAFRRVANGGTEHIYTKIHFAVLDAFRKLNENKKNVDVVDEDTLALLQRGELA